MTVGARILLLPGATIFWPLIIARWRQARLSSTCHTPMRRPHRSVHRVVWPLLALIVACGFTLALILRAPPT